MREAVDAREGPVDRGDSFAARLDALWRACRKGHGSLSYAEAATAITAATGTSITHTALWKLRTGRHSNPHLKTLRALADFFGVSPSYFVIDEQDMLPMLHGLAIDPAALRVLADLSPAAQAQIAEEILATAWSEAESARSSPTELPVDDR